MTASPVHGSESDRPLGPGPPRTPCILPRELLLPGWREGSARLDRPGFCRRHVIQDKRDVDGPGLACSRSKGGGRRRPPWALLPSLGAGVGGGGGRAAVNPAHEQDFRGRRVLASGCGLARERAAGWPTPLCLVASAALGFLSRPDASLYHHPLPGRSHLPSSFPNLGASRGASHARALPPRLAQAETEVSEGVGVGKDPAERVPFADLRRRERWSRERAEGQRGLSGHRGGRCGRES